jgi:hypothetical protein
VERREIVSAAVIRPGAHAWTSVVGALALFAAFVVAVNLWIGHDQLPREIRASALWFVASTLALAAVTGVLRTRARRRLTLVEQDGRQVLEIDARPPVLLSAPFTVRTGWGRIPAGRTPSTILVQAVFSDGDRVALVLTEEWGALATPPPWPEGFVTFEEAEAVYRSGGIRFLVPLLDALERRSG